MMLPLGWTWLPSWVVLFAPLRCCGSGPQAARPLPNRQKDALGTTSVGELLACGAPDMVSVIWLLCLGCCKERVPGEVSQPAGAAKDSCRLPLKRTGKKLPLDLVFPDA